ncbi:14657_t:CDS:2 [Cetraspora pellucida]|uniref:ATP-dependent DNA helicase n=1 Tax=Cetraspora pellucida TaxID=1433469 RepID=A0A9N9CUR5_9GLOM|nr:14657_t:CDS:2 [Cetraspora pellucida]
MKEVVHYLNSLATTINSELNAPIPAQHLCQKHLEELNDDLQDYVELINKLQCHTHCSSSYCLRTNKQTGKQFCRFRFLKELKDETVLHNENGYIELITARNDPLINSHDCLQLQEWQANVDLKPILSTYAALYYGTTDILIMQKYWNRPNELQELSLFKLYLQYKLVRGKWIKCNKKILFMFGLVLHQFQMDHKINADLIDLIGSSMENIVVNNNNSNEQDQDNTQEGSNVNYYWVGESQLQYPELDVENFIQQAIHDNVIAKNNNINDNILLLLASTGVTAFNIQGSTIHSALFILITGTNYDLESNRLKTLQNKLQKIQYIIIDEMRLVNGAIGTIEDILFKYKVGPTSLPTAVLVAFDEYHEGKFGICSCLQILLSFAWVITTHKLQGLTLPKAVIDIGKKEFTAGLSFVAISCICSLQDILLSPFTFEKLLYIKNCKRMQECLAKESRLMEFEITKQRAI